MVKTYIKHKLLLILSLFIISGQLSAQQSNQYYIANTINAEGNGGWDYLTMDEDHGNLFISHANVVQVLNVISGKVIATIPDTKGVHGITLAAALNKGYISNGRDSSVTVFDLNTFKTLHKVTVTGKNPDAILYDQFSNKVFVFNGRSNNATVIDAKTDVVIATIALDGKPEFAATNLAGRVYVNIEDKNKIAVINSNTLKVEAQWPITPGKEASGLAIDNQKHRLFTVCDNKLMIIINADNGAVITTMPIGEGPDGVVFDTGSKRAFSANGEGTLTVVEESGDTYNVVETVSTHTGARTIAVNSKTHHLYLPCAEYGAKPVATPENPNPRPSIKESSFVILDIAPVVK